MTAESAVRSVVERGQFEKDILAERPFLRAFGISLSGSTDTAEDLVQDTLVKAITNRHQFEQGTNLRAWLITILRNIFYSMYRKAKWSETWDPSFEDSIKFSTGIFTDGGSSFDFNRTLLYLAALSRDQSDVLVGVGYAEMQYDEMAAVLGCELGTVKSRINRAREKLQELLDTVLIDSADLRDLKYATKGLSKSDPYYPIAQAYEELYSGLPDTINVSEEAKSAFLAPVHKESKLDMAWDKLLEAGALDDLGDDDSELE